MTTAIPYLVDPDGTPGMLWHPVTGCTKVSAGCAHCWAQNLAETRLAHTSLFPNGWTPTLHPERLEEPLHWRKPRRVFIAPFGDLFHPAVPFEFIGHVFDAMLLAGGHTFLVLTKRPERMSEFCQRKYPQPLSNVWLGTSAENQETLDARLPHLLRTPAVVHWLSLEPLLGPVDLGWAMPCRDDCNNHPLWAPGIPSPVSWVVVGGESGPSFRPMDEFWARSIIAQCQAAGVPVWFKQHAGRWPGRGVELDGKVHQELPEVAR